MKNNVQKNKYDMMEDFITLINFTSCTDSGCTFYGLNKCVMYDECHYKNYERSFTKLCQGQNREIAREILKKKYNL